MAMVLVYLRLFNKHAGKIYFFSKNQDEQLADKVVASDVAWPPVLASFQ